MFVVAKYVLTPLLTRMFMWIVVPLCCIFCLISTNTLHMCMVTTIALLGTTFAQYTRFKSINGIGHRYKILTIYSCLCFTLGMACYSAFAYFSTIFFYNVSILFFLSTCFLDIIFTLIKSTFLQRDTVYHPNHINLLSFLIFCVALLLLFFDQRLESIFQLKHASSIDLIKFYMVVSPTLSCLTAIIGLVLSLKHWKELALLACATFSIIVFHLSLFLIKSPLQPDYIICHRFFTVSIMICGILIYLHAGLLQKPADNYNKDPRHSTTLFTISLMLCIAPIALAAKAVYSNTTPNAFIFLFVFIVMFFALAIRLFPLVDLLVLLRNDFEKEALVDSLTNIANRRSILQHLEQYAHEERCIIFIDINDFKAFNDYYGHHFGDYVITFVAQHLKKNLKDNLTSFHSPIMFGRLGGDEFVVILHKNQIKNKRFDVEKFTQDLKDELSGWKLIKGHYVYVGISIGASAWGVAHHKQLMHQADIAMLDTKKDKDFKYNIADETDRKLYQSRHYRREIILKHFKSESILPIQYQKIVHFPSLEIVAYEALARLHGDTGELLYPKDFFDLIERDNLHLELLYAVIRSLEQIPPMYANAVIHINVTPSILDIENIYLWLHERVQSAQRASNNIVLELTETEGTLVSDNAKKNLTMLQQLGYKIALDDYGVGHSSLARISQSPISIVKLDRSLVAATETGNTLLVKNIADLAKKHHWCVVAEGVETLAQAEMMHKYSIQYMQGYYFSKPHIF